MDAIIKVFKEEIPSLRFIGKKYDGFGHWGEWFGGGWFDVIESAMGGVEAITKIWENGGGYVGLEIRTSSSFAYMIGMFAPAETAIPEGFEAIDFDGVSLGTCWIYGKENEVHETSGCREKIEEAGMELWTDKDGAVYSFENCLCPRYTTPDEKGNVILDYCYVVK